MANYVSNWFGVSGSTEDIQAFMAKAGKPYSQKWSNSDKEEVMDCGFAFWNFVRPPEEDLDYYYGRKQEEKPKGYEKWSDEKQMAWRMSFSGKNASDWNYRNWGISHDIWDLTHPAEIEISADGKTASVNYSFESKWSIPEQGFRAITEQHPELSFDFEGEEEQGWGATYSGVEGEFTTTETWDIPDSHEDNAKRDRTCQCEWSNDQPHDWYDDCPDKAIEIKRHHLEYGYDGCECEGAVEEPDVVY